MNGSGDFLKGLYGFLDSNAKVIVAAKYDEAQPFSEGLAWVRSGNKWGAIDHQGSLVIPMKSYISVTPFRNGISTVATVSFVKNGEFLIINRLGKVISSQ